MQKPVLTCLGVAPKLDIGWLQYSPQWLLGTHLASGTNAIVAQLVAASEMN